MRNRFWWVHVHRWLKGFYSLFPVKTCIVFVSRAQKHVSNLFTKKCVCAHLLFELRFLLLHQLTLTPRLCGILQQLKQHSTVSSTALTGTADTFNTNMIKNSVLCLRFYFWSTTGYLLLAFAKNTIRPSEKEQARRMYSQSLSLFAASPQPLSSSRWFSAVWCPSAAAAAPCAWTPCLYAARVTSDFH